MKLRVIMEVMVGIVFKEECHEKDCLIRYFPNALRGIWNSDETPFRGCVIYRHMYLASQTINNWRNFITKFTKVYGNKITFPNLLHGSDFLCFLFMNY